jgi:hypothetical protein
LVVRVALVALRGVNSITEGRESAAVGALAVVLRGVRYAGQWSFVGLLAT